MIEADSQKQKSTLLEIIGVFGRAISRETQEAFRAVAIRRVRIGLDGEVPDPRLTALFRNDQELFLRIRSRQ